LSVLVLSLNSFQAHLDARTVIWHVAVLVTAYQNDVLEPADAWTLAQLKQVGLFRFVRICHGQLAQGVRFCPVFDEPHASVDQRIRIVHVAEVRRPQTHEPVHLLPQLGQVFQ
jgi:hypothetical protein